MTPEGESKGWAYIRERERRALSRAHATLSLLDNDENCQVGVEIKRDTPSAGDRLISLKPNPSEIENAPSAIRGVINDLGIKPEDRIDLEFYYYKHFWGFGFSITPENITDTRLGLSLSITPSYKSKVTALRHDIKEHESIVEDMSFNARPPLYTISSETSLALKTYGEMDSYYRADGRTTLHPHKGKIMTGAVEWARKIIEGRQKAHEAQKEQEEKWNNSVRGLKPMD